MSYTTEQDLYTIIAERILIQLSSDDPLASEPDYDVLAEARAYADAQIDARLRQRYSLPLATVPRELKDWSLALSRQWLYSRRPDGQDLPTAVIQAAQEAIRALDAVRDGKISLDVQNQDGGTTASESARLYVIAPTRLFTVDKLAGY